MDNIFFNAAKRIIYIREKKEKVKSKRNIKVRCNVAALIVWGRL